MTSYGRQQEREACEATVRNVFSGSAYKVPKNIFDLLADERIHIPEELKYFPYRATSDFENLKRRPTREKYSKAYMGR